MSIRLAQEAELGRLRHLILDWDGTMTCTDTTSLIGAAAIEACQERAKKLRNSTSASDECALSPLSASEIMKACVDAYMQDYESWKVGSLPTFSGASEEDSKNDLVDQVVTSIATATNDAETATAIATELHRLNNMQQIERRSFLRVRSAALHGRVLDTPLPAKHQEEPQTLPDDYRATMRAAGAAAVRDGRIKIRDRDGLRRLLAWAASAESNAINTNDLTTRDWAIVSVSWSKAFMIGAITESNLFTDSPSTTTDPASMRSADSLASKIWCNELLEADHQTDESRLIQTAGDKLEAMRDAINALSTNTPDATLNVDAHDDQMKTAVYIGDSSTDLACLLAAGLGICIRDEGMDEGSDKLALKLGELGIRCLSLDVLIRGDEDEREIGSEAPTLYWTTSFSQVMEVLQVLENQQVTDPNSNINSARTSDRTRFQT